MDTPLWKRLLIVSLILVGVALIIWGSVLTGMTFEEWKHNGFWTHFGLILLGLFIVLLIGAGAFFVGLGLFAGFGAMISYLVSGNAQGPSDNMHDIVRWVEGIFERRREARQSLENLTKKNS